LGIGSSFALVSCPQANSVAQRFSRTVHEQITQVAQFPEYYGLPWAMGDFVDWCNAQRRIEKNGFLPPKEDREAPA
jgi:hypothetical protein